MKCEICKTNEAEIENKLYEVSVWTCESCAENRLDDIWLKISRKYKRFLASKVRLANEEQEQS